MQNKTNQGQKVVSPVLDRVISEMSNFLSKQGWGLNAVAGGTALPRLSLSAHSPPWGWVQHLPLHEVNAAPISMAQIYFLHPYEARVFIRLMRDFIVVKACKLS